MHLLRGYRVEAKRDLLHNHESLLPTKQMLNTWQGAFGEIMLGLLMYLPCQDLDTHRLKDPTRSRLRI